METKQDEDKVSKANRIVNDLLGELGKEDESQYDEHFRDLTFHSKGEDGYEEIVEKTANDLAGDMLLTVFMQAKNFHDIGTIENKDYPGKFLISAKSKGMEFVTPRGFTDQKEAKYVAGYAYYKFLRDRNETRKVIAEELLSKGYIEKYNNPELKQRMFDLLERENEEARVNYLKWRL